ncbi:translation initiation factor IF-2 [Nannocystis bainbridge]|uniref:Translation initiation factor IF-2 n=1 Tax=Nannocystis bainbridge TaxID=2995303 RepID=A0ABT5DQQ1_9BACT|nr:translation initiation factor IF-2 [Nannocystis bainbridge]MDC0715374.1 translation initiation factor IF-2 [Nannocystis bainbridge]
MAKIRVYELAKELSKDNKVMENVIRGLGVEIKGVMSTLDDDQAELVRRHIQGGERREPERNDPRAGAPAPVIRRAGRGPRPADEGEEEAAAPRPTPPPVVRPAPVQQQQQPPVVRRPVPPPVSGQPPVRPSTPVVRPSEPSRPPETPWSTPVQSQPREPQREVRAVAEPIEVREPTPRPSAPEQAQVQAEPPAPPRPVTPPSEPEPVRSEPVEPVRSEPVEPARPAEQVQSAEPVQPSQPSQPIVAPPPVVAPQPPAPPAPVQSQPVQPPIQRPVSQPIQRPAQPSGSRPEIRRSEQRQQQPPQPAAPRAPAPEVGSRIQLPPGTKRLPGGVASRMEDSPREPRIEPHRRGPDGPRGTPPQGQVGPVGTPLRPGVQTRPGPGKPGAPTQTGTRPLGSGPQLGQTGPRGQVVQPAPVATRPGDRGGSTTRYVVPATPQAQQPPQQVQPPPVEPEVNRRVLRDEAGVIVGAASQRAEPKILGFVQLANRPRPQQVIITDASDSQQRGRATIRKEREERAQQQGRKRKTMIRNVRGRPGLPGARPSTQEMSESKKRIRVDEAIPVADLAHQMGKKATMLLKTLWGMGLRGVTINSAVDAETAELVAAEYGYTVENVAFQEDQYFDEDTEEGAGDVRAPVVTIMGHVDHGKTSLLDRIRKATVAEGEAGGITQHIGAYKVSTAKGDVVFLDTPGHEAFSAMRARGAQVTDVVVLVVAADDGIMPTTVEAIKHAREANVPLVVALNKIDKPDANPGRVKQMLMEYSLVGEEYGGETIICEVSAKTGKGIDHLLEMLAIQSEILDLRATTEGRAIGVVLEARVDKGRGPIATVLVEAGTLRKGDIVVANEFSGKVRGMLDDRGRTLEDVGPSTPVEVLGLDGVPSAGDRFNVVESEKAARQLVTHRREVRRRKESARSGPSIADFIQRKKTPTLKIVLRADVQGSAEALKQALLELSTDKVKVEVISSGVGAITQTDVKTASAGEAVIIGFNTKPVGKAGQIADAEKVPVYTFNVIYNALDKTRELMVGLLEPEYRERDQGEAEVRALFPIPKIGVVAGCRVTRGLIQRSHHVRVVRGGTIIHKGRISSLRVLKDDVKEVREGFECGIVIDSFPEVEPGDILQAFEIETIAPTL